MSTRGFVIRRFIQTVITMFLVLSMMWALFRLVPGDPLVIFLGQGELAPQELERIRAAWGLDQPGWVQYLQYIYNFMTGDLGQSFYFRRPVTEVLWEPLVNTLILMLPAVTIAIGLGVFLGSRLGWRRGSRLEALSNLAILIPRAVPVFWLAIIVLVLFSYQLGWFPIGGMETIAFIPQTWWERLPGFDLLYHLALPLLVAVLVFLSDPLLIMRTSMIEVAQDDFVTYARARGLHESKVRNIARRNALMPVITYSAIMVGFAFGGQVLLEVVFSWPGMGRLMVNSVHHRDYPVAQAAFFLMAGVVVLLNFIVDILYLYLDPRVSYE